MRSRWVIITRRAVKTIIVSYLKKKPKNFFKKNCRRRNPVNFTWTFPVLLLHLGEIASSVQCSSAIVNHYSRLSLLHEFARLFASNIIVHCVPAIEFDFRFTVFFSDVFPFLCLFANTCTVCARSRAASIYARVVCRKHNIIQFTATAIIIMCFK